MNYQECIHYLEEEVGFGSVPGLERIELLCEKLGNPEQKLPIITMAFEEVSLEKIFLSLTDEKNSKVTPVKNIKNTVPAEADEDDYTPIFGSDTDEEGDE